MSYNIDQKPTSEYTFKLTDKVTDNQILIYEDNYAIVTKENIKYNNLNDIPQLTIGVLSSELNDVNYYLKENKNIIYKTYDKVTDLFVSMNATTNGVDAIVIPKTIYLKEIVENDHLNISYNITEMKKSLVLELGSDKKLNRIIKKYYEKWSRDNKQESYNINFSENYFAFKQIYEQEKVNFKSKQYSYAFIDYAPYDALVNKQLVGLNLELIKGFAKLSDIEISYNEYKNYSSLLEKFNENKIDFYLNTSNNTK